MVSLLPTLKIFSKTTILHATLGLQRRIVVPVFNTNSYGRRAFSVVALLLWNSLPQHIRDAGSLDIFKRRLQTTLFIRAF